MLKSFLRHLEVVPGENDTPTSTWSNYDVICLPPSRRTWGRFDFFSFWSIQALSISTWQTATVLIIIGLNIWQSMLCIVLARFIIAAVALSHGWGGSVWHVGFPIYSRFTFGYWGSYVALLQRIVLCMVWYSVQSYTCGLLIAVLLSSVFPGFNTMKDTLPPNIPLKTQELIGWIIYHVLSLPILFIAPENFNLPFKFITFCSFIAIFGTSIGLIIHARGIGDLKAFQHKNTWVKSDIAWKMVFGINAVINTFAVGLTNQPDFSRFAKRPGVQIWGQSFSIIVFSSVVPLMAIFATSANLKSFPGNDMNVWNPPFLIASWLHDEYSPKSRCAAFFSSLGFLISTAGLNLIDNGVSGGIDLVAIAPRYFNIRRGTLFIMIVSIAIQPWNILKNALIFLNVLGSYGCFFGPMIGVFTADYFIVRSRKLKLSDLYSGSKNSIYWFYHGWNLRAFLSWVCGFVPGITGVATLNPSIKSIPKASVELFRISFLIGYAISFVVHVGINYFFPPPGIGEIDEYDIFGTFTETESRNLGIKPNEEWLLQGISIHEEDLKPISDILRVKNIYQIPPELQHGNIVRTDDIENLFKFNIK